MTEESWNKHTPGDPMPCKCGESVIQVRVCGGVIGTDLARNWDWDKSEAGTLFEIDAWRFVERKGEDVIQRCARCYCEGGSSECNWIKTGPADPYPTLEWDEDGIATAVLKKPGQPWWVRDDDLVRFHRLYPFEIAANWDLTWNNEIAFQIKRRPVLTPAVPQVLKMLAVATDDEADAIRQAARRANIEVPE